MTELLIHSGKLKGRKLDLPAGEILIGRDESCQIRMASTDISRQHCRLRCTPSGLYIADLESRNGTFVNDVLIQAEVLLKPGDLVRVGPLELLVPPASAPVSASPSIASAHSAGAPGSSANTAAGSVSRETHAVPAEPGTRKPVGNAAASARAGDKPMVDLSKPSSPKPKKATDDDIASWLTEDDSVASASPSDTTIIPGGSRSRKESTEPPTPAPTPAPVADPPRDARKAPRSVQEEAAEIIRRHHEQLRKKREG